MQTINCRLLAKNDQIGRGLELSRIAVPFYW